MLQFLRIENLALMESVALEFGTGFTAVTGETGAGKSVLLGALSLLAGNRAEKTLIREGAVQCRVEAVLEVAEKSRVSRFLDEAGLPACEEGQLVLTRVLDREKAARVMINGSVATLSQLQHLSLAWIDFHGPGEPQKLFAESEQLKLLDLFAGQKAAVAHYCERYRAWRAEMDLLDRLRGEQRLSPEEAAFLKMQVSSIDDLRLSKERIDQLETQYKRISGAQELRELSTQAAEILNGEEGILDKMRSLLPAGRALAAIDSTLQPLSDRIESLLIEMDDLAEEVAAIEGGEELTDDDIQEVEAAMESWLSLSRKYGPSVEQVLAKREAMANRLALQGNVKEVMAAKEADIAQREKELRELAVGLKSARKKAAHSLAKQAEVLLQELGFKHPKLTIEILNEDSLKAHGDSSCQMRFSPNPGKAPLPLNKIASSGEMARVMLAIKTVLAAIDATPVLVFDEVDANIGGEVASAVARLLRKLGENHQVFCITHLPQVASDANHHFVVRKDQDDASTRIDILCLDGDRPARLDEFARMLGDRHSEAARQHAASLMQ